MTRDSGLRRGHATAAAVSDAERPEAARQALVTAARERLRAHLDREAAEIAGDGDPERVLTAVRQLTEQLRAEEHR